MRGRAALSFVNMFYHINLTTKRKGDDGFQSGVNNVFFAEATRIKGEDVHYVLSCFCMVEPNDNGQCYGCVRYGNVDLKHPVDVDKYKGGHSYRYSPCSGFDPRRDTPDPDVPAYIQDEEDRLAYEEATIRSMYENACWLFDQKRRCWFGQERGCKARVKSVVPARRQLV